MTRPTLPRPLAFGRTAPDYQGRAVPEHAALRLAPQITRRGRLRRAALVLALSCVASTSTLTGVALAAPSAAEKETARSLLGAGQKKFDAGDFAGALEAWAAADEIMKVPTTGLRVGKAQEKLGKLVEARDTWLRVSRSPVAEAEPRAITAARKEASSLAVEVGKRIPSVSVKVAGVAADVELSVSVDGVSVPPAAALLPYRVNPGEHQVSVSAAGYSQADASVSLAEGDNKTLEVTLTPVAQDAAPPVVQPLPPSDARPPAQPPPESQGPRADSSSGGAPWTVIGFSLAGVGVAVGAITGAMSSAKTSDIKETCDGNRCPGEAQADIDSASTLALISNIGFGVGIAGLGIGIYGLLSGGDGDSARVPPDTLRLGKRGVTLTPVVGLGSLNVVGNF